VWALQVSQKLTCNDYTAADLTHVENKPSIATVIASMDSRSLPLLYQASISVQRLLEPAPNSPCEYSAVDRSEPS